MLNNSSLQSLPPDLLKEIYAYLSLSSLTELKSLNQFFARSELLNAEISKRLNQYMINSIAANGLFTLFLRHDHRVLLAGCNIDDAYQISTVLEPQLIPDFKQIVSIQAGGKHALLLTQNGNVYGLGLNCSGQIGSGSRFWIKTKLKLANAQQIAAGGYHSLFLLKDGTVLGCGANLASQLGVAVTNDRNPFPLTGLPKVKNIYAGTLSSFFMAEDGGVWACGSNETGGLGLNGNNIISTPQRIPNLPSMKAIAPSETHTLFLAEDGSVWACGDNEYGQLGLGHFNTQITPQKLTSLPPIKAISVGLYHSIFLTTDGQVWGCGRAQEGQLGEIIKTTISQPRLIQGISDVVTATCSKHTSFFQTKDKQVFACGSNQASQLGIIQQQPIFSYFKPSPYIRKITPVTSLNKAALLLRRIEQKDVPQAKPASCVIL